MTSKNRNRLIVLTVLAVPAVIFIGSIFYNAFSLPPLPPMPNPNGYDDLVKAAKMLAPNIDDYGRTTNQDELRVIVLADINGLKLARAGLQKQCHVPLSNTVNGSTGTISPEYIKDLAFAFAAEGDLAEIQGHADEAARSYLDIVHLANESSRGGVIIDELVAIVIERIGTDKLRQLSPQLNAKACRETASALETLDAQRQSWDDVMRQEDYWSRRQFSGIRDKIQTIMDYKEIEKINYNCESVFHKQQMRTRKLIIDLAARAYELDKGHPVGNIGDLVPNYLNAIPQDPFTGANMTYLPR